MRKFIDQPAKSPAQEAHSEVGWGIVMGIFGVVVALAVAGLYLWSPGQPRVKADFAEAGMIRTGDGVRMAGIQVGTVKSVDLKTDHVEVTMAVDRDVKVGDESTAEVKMLTIVGGNYIDITPMGRNRLGSKHIPVSRSTVPYSLMETFQSITPKLEKIDASPLRDVLSQVQTGFSANPGAIRENLRTMQNMLVNLNKNQDAFGGLLKMAADYTKAINANGDVITALLRDLSSFITEITGFRGRWMYMLNHVTPFLERLGGVLANYQSDIDPLVRQIDEIGREFGPLMQRYTPMIDQARALITKLEQTVQPDGSIVLNGGTILTSNFCIPLLGVKC